MKKTSISNDKPPRLYKYVENLKFSTRLAVVNALRKRTDLNKLNKEENNFYLKTNKITNDLKDFNKDFESNMKVYKEISQENDVFAKKYKIAKGKNDLNKKDFSSTSNFQKTFADLIANYKEHGYKIPDLSVKKKLFERSPLLIENDKIVRYYLLGDYRDIYKKDLRFTTKLNNLINQRIAKEERILGLREAENKSSNRTEVTNEENRVKTIKNLVKDVKSNEEQLARSKSLVETGAFKQLFELKKGKNSRIFIQNDNIRHNKDKGKEPIKGHHNEKTRKESKKNIETNKQSITRQSLPKFVKKQTIKSIQNDESMKSISIRNLFNPSETARIRDISTINSSIYTDKSKTMKNFNIDPNIVRMNSLGRNSCLIEFESQDILAKDKEDIKNDIENAISWKQREMEELNNVYEKIVGKDDVKKIIIDYYGKIGKDKNLIEDNWNKKLEPHDLLRYFSETKNKINNSNINETHKNFTSRYGPLDISNKELSRVKELDDKLSRLDYILVRELNKLHKQ